MSAITVESYLLKNQTIGVRAAIRRKAEYAANLEVTALHDLFDTESMAKLNDYYLFKEFDDRWELTTRIHLWPALNGDLETGQTAARHVSVG